MLNIHYNDSQLLSKSFSFISNYNISFLEFFYICGLFMIVYISIKLYYVLSKKEDFISVNEYQENEERNEEIKNIFSSVISRNISYVFYFLITFTPTNIIMIIKILLGKSNIQSYYIDYIVIMLISFNGTFLFIVRLFDPLVRNFIINLFLFNREFIKNYYKDYLIKEKRNESVTEESIYLDHNMSKNERFLENTTKIEEYPENGNEKVKSILPFERVKSESVILKDKHKYTQNFSCSSVSDKKTSVKIKKDYEMNFFNLDNKEKNNIENQKEDCNKKENENKDLSLNKNSVSNRDNSLKMINKEEQGEKRIGNVNDINANIINLQKINILEDKEKNNYFNINASESLGKENMNLYKSNSPKLRSKTIFNIHFMNKLKKKNFPENEKTNLLKGFNDNQVISNNVGISKSRSSSIATHFHKRRFLPDRHSRRDSGLKKNDIFYHERISSFAYMNYHLELNENLIRMIAISISINECRMYDDVNEYKKYYNLTIPWENKELYKEKTLFKEYNDDSIPSWIGIKDDSRFTNIQFKVMAYSPFVFHHIRLIDNISIDDLLSSLNPLNNIKIIKKMKVSGGRGNNSLISTWDKKIIIKTIDDNEREILIDKMIIDYHCLMKESKSILSRIYGLFKIELKDKESLNVIIQKNMEDLPLHTKILTFDLKGSTVDRKTIDDTDAALSEEKFIEKYKKKVLKDVDLSMIGLKFVLNFANWQNITSIINSDSLFLENLEVTDYSLIVFVHKYRKEDIINFKGCSRIIPSIDNKYIFNFSIVDFLGPFNLEKKSEKYAKILVGYFKKLKDTNFSVLEPKGYGERFRNFCKQIIIDG